MSSAAPGFATVWTALAVTSLMIILGLVVGFVVLIGTRHRVEAAADLAALAAALPADETTACRRAVRVAERMHTRLRTCRFRGWDSLVEIEADPPGPFRRFGPVNGRARAGPVP